MNKIASIEEYLRGTGTTEEKLLLDANTILDSGLAEDIQAQEKAYRLIHLYGRQRIREELKLLSRTLSTHTDHRNFWSGILKIFKR